MKEDFQSKLFELIKVKINNKDSLGNVLGDILNISQDAVYRRFRGETLLTIFELKKLYDHFNISLDALFEAKANRASFEYQPLEGYDFNMDRYLENLRDGLKMIASNANPELILSVNNIPILQLLNYPHLVRFKLFFWAKTHLQVPEFQDRNFNYEKISQYTFNTGLEALKIYNTIPSREIYDPELLRGLVREIYYYYESQQFEDPNYAIYILEVMDRFVDHLEAQAAAGKKFVSTTEPPASGNEFEMYYNETFNSNTTVYYKTDAISGIYIGHNQLNSLHTNESSYVEDSFGVLKKQIANSSVISVVNEKDRKNFFSATRRAIDNCRKKIELDMSS